MGKKLALGAVIAAVAGVVAGTLMAPKSGKQTRSDIKKTATTLKKKTTSKSKGKRTAKSAKAKR